MPRIFAIGDIHGCSKTFKSLLLEKIQIRKSDIIYCIGDYVDRGPDSKGVLDLIIQLREEGYHIHTLRGNHEQMMLDSILDKETLEHWLRNGGRETLKSFGIKSIKALPDKYLEFLKHTEFFIATDKYVFVHAGLNFYYEDPFSDKEEMLWTRETYFDRSKINNRILIHGHTPIPIEKIHQQADSYMINIDGGCVYSDKPGLGNLVAVSLPDMQILSVENMD